MASNSATMNSLIPLVSQFWSFKTCLHITEMTKDVAEMSSGVGDVLKTKDQPAR